MNTTIKEIDDLRDAYWGLDNADPPTRTQREARLKTHLHKFFDTSTKRFIFTIGNNDNKRTVCENAWLRVLGEINNTLLVYNYYFIECFARNYC